MEKLKHYLGVGIAGCGILAAAWQLAHKPVDSVDQFIDQIAAKHERKPVLVCFEGHPCPPCEIFKPVLTDAFNTKLQPAGWGLEVVNVSDPTDHQKYEALLNKMTGFIGTPTEAFVIDGRVVHKLVGAPTNTAELMQEVSTAYKNANITIPAGLQPASQ